MDNKTYLGSLGEAKVISKLTEEKFHIFSQITGKAPFDLIAVKENLLFRVSVKSVEKSDKYNNYVVQLKSVRSNRHTNKIINFDNTSCDLLCVYIVDLDKVVILDAKQITAKSALSLGKKENIISGF